MSGFVQKNFVPNSEIYYYPMLRFKKKNTQNKQEKKDITFKHGWFDIMASFTCKISFKGLVYLNSYPMLSWAHFN